MPVPLPMNRTHSYLGNERHWGRAWMEVDDRKPSGEGCVVRLYGTGHVVVNRVSREREAKRYEFRLPVEETRRLFHLMIEQDVVTAKSYHPATVKNPGWSNLTLMNSKGWSEFISKLNGVEEPRFDAAFRELRRVDELVGDRQPGYTGPYQSWYRPKLGAAGMISSLRMKLDDLRSTGLRDIGRFIGDMLILMVKLYPLYIIVGLMVMIAWFVAEIDPAHTYGFAGGVLHGFFIIQNGILALFTDRQVTAPVNTGTWYTVGLMVGMVVVPGIVTFVMDIVFGVVRGGKL